MISGYLVGLIDAGLPVIDTEIQGVLVITYHLSFIFKIEQKEFLQKWG